MTPTERISKLRQKQSEIKRQIKALKQDLAKVESSIENWSRVSDNQIKMDI